jgi:CRP-like cAMP-binding protein
VLEQHDQWQHLRSADFSAIFQTLCENIRELNQACHESGNPDSLLWQLLHEQAHLEIECLFLLLSYRYGVRQIGQIHYNFSLSADVQRGSTRVRRANAFELLDELLPRRLAAEVIRLLDEFSRAGSHDGSGLSDEIFSRLCRKEPWLRAVAAYSKKNYASVTLTSYERDLYEHIPDVAFLKQVPLFQDVPGNYLMSLAHITQPIRIRSGEILFSQDEPGNAMYLICRGMIHVMVGKQEIDRQSRGTCIGEMSILDGAPRSASCVATEDTELLMLHANDVERLLLNQTSVSLALLQTLTTRLRQQTLRAVQPPDEGRRTSSDEGRRMSHEWLNNTATMPTESFENIWQSSPSGALDSEGIYHLMKRMAFLKRVPLFQDISDQYLLALTELTSLVHLLPGESLCEEGELGDAMYILRQGMISVQVRGVEVNQIAEGECIGEMALLDHAPRSATCIACDKAELLKISASDFETVLRSQPSVVLALLRTIAARLRHQTVQATS